MVARIWRILKAIHTQNNIWYVETNRTRFFFYFFLILFECAVSSMKNWKKKSSAQNALNNEIYHRAEFPVILSHKYNHERKIKEIYPVYMPGNAKSHIRPKETYIKNFNEITIFWLITPINVIFCCSFWQNMPFIFVNCCEREQNTQ